MMDKLEDFQPVKFNHSNGSTGKILSATHYDENTYYVEWCYGLDVKGEPILSKSSVKRSEVIKINQEDYDKVRNGPAFGRKEK